jgi:hypothetical protein
MLIRGRRRRRRRRRRRSHVHVEVVLLTPWSTVTLDKLRVAQLVKK